MCLFKHELKKIYLRKSILIILAFYCFFAVMNVLVPSIRNHSNALEAQSLVQKYNSHRLSIVELNHFTSMQKDRLRDYTNITDFNMGIEEERVSSQKNIDEMKAKGIKGFEYKSSIMQNNMLKKLPVVSKPYYTGFWLLINRSSAEVIVILLLCLGLAGVFSDEYSTGIDSVILSSKYGKGKITISKILAACVYSVSIVLLFFIIQFVTVLLYYRSIKGWDSPIQCLIFMSRCPFTFSVLQYYLFRLFIILLGAIALGLVILLISSRSRNTLITFFISFLFVMIPSALLGGSFFTPEFSSAWRLTKVYDDFLSADVLVNSFNTVNIFGTPVWRVIADGILLIVLSGISLYGAYHSFRKHQVSN